MTIRRIPRTTRLFWVLVVAHACACAKPSQSTNADKGSGARGAATASLTPTAPDADRAHRAVVRAKAFLAGVRARDTQALGAAVSFPFTLRDPDGELCGTRERIFKAAGELEELLTCIRKHESTALLLDSNDDFQTEPLQPDLAAIVAPEMPAIVAARTPIVTSLYGNGFTAHWTVQVDADGVRELWVKNFYEAN
jgi:hypothetical protein